MLVFLYNFLNSIGILKFVKMIPTEEMDKIS